MSAIRKSFGRARQGQRGVTLVIALVLLVAMMLAGVAIFRSVDTSTFLAANLAFKRDLDNRASMAVQPVLERMKTAAFIAAWDMESCKASTDPQKSASDCASLWKGWAYSPRLLAAEANGVPSLLSDIAWTASGDTPSSAFDTAFSSSASVDTGSKTRQRYLIERMCTDDAMASEDNCILDGALEQGGSQPNDKPGAVPLPMFRVTVRIEGPRHAVSYAQAIVTVRAE